MKRTTEDFIKMARQIHGDRYDYTKTEYKGIHEKVCIICPVHGEFWQEAKSHLHGLGCKKCSDLRRKSNKDEFIEKAKQIHGDKYDYSKVDYINDSTKVCIICKEHGEFWQRARDHLNGHGCSKCSGFLSTDTDSFIQRARQIHGDKYDYSKVEYTNNSTKVCIICKEHGEFWQTPNRHLNGQGCPQCSKSHKLTKDSFIERAKKIHGNKYDYSKVNYVNSTTKVCIICHTHGEFWQKPQDHIHSQQGCPFCQESHLEKSIEIILNENKIAFEKQKRFDWLGKQSLDFYLPQYNIAIECQGGQHFKCVAHFGGEKSYADILERDKRKKKLCEENNVKLLYYSNLGIEYSYKVIENKDELLKEIYR